MRFVKSRWTFLVLLALIASTWLIFAVPRLHPAARLGLRYNREGYLSLARKFVSTHGFNASGWPGYAKHETLVKNQEFRLVMPSDPMAHMFPDSQILVTLIPPGKASGAQITLRPDGHLLGWKFPEYLQIKAIPQNSSDVAMHELAGQDSADYRMAKSGGTSGTTQDKEWKYREDDGKKSAPSAPHVEIDLSEKNGAVWQANTVFTIPETVAGNLNAFPLIRTVIGGVWFVLLLTAIIIPVLREGSGRTARAMKDRSVLTLSAAAALGVGLNSLVEWDDAIAGISGASGFFTEVLGILVGAVMVGILFYIVLAGTVVNAGLHPARVRGFRLLGTRAIFSRTVARELFAGWLLAPVLLALPLAVGLALQAHVFRGYDDDMLLGRSPVLATLLGAAAQNTVAVASVFGILIPLALRLFRNPRIAAIAACLLAALSFAALSAPFRGTQPPNLMWAAVQGCLMVWTYFRFGMLAGMIGFGGTEILNAASTMLLQPAQGLHDRGWGILVVFGSMGVGALVLAWRGPDAVAELYGESGIRLQARSRREELLAEFNVARSAQQQMLPARPPHLEGYTLAASCDPAREVGGDLYDFLRLKDGRWGIGVADVSGKGVPAALYMTLTKGLLSAASQDSGDPHYILGVVNKHLRTVVKKKVFVTMALGVLDPGEGTVDYARAGHNPIVWRRTSAGETELLGGGGLGLGIAGPVLFGKTLKVQTLSLSPGDALIFYSDGLTEAMNEELEQFGEERLIAATERTDGLDAGATRDSILREVKHFLNGGNSQDDLTIAVLRVNEESLERRHTVSN